jgi:hypothetical protein
MNTIERRMDSTLFQLGTAKNGQRSKTLMHVAQKRKSKRRRMYIKDRKGKKRGRKRKVKVDIEDKMFEQ